MISLLAVQFLFLFFVDIKEGLLAGIEHFSEQLDVTLFVDNNYYCFPEGHQKRINIMCILHE